MRVDQEKRSLWSLILNDSGLFAQAAGVLVSGLVGAVTILGYSYANSYYGKLGVQLSELGFGFIDYIYRGLFFMISLRSALMILGVLFLFTVVVLASRRAKWWILEVGGYLFAFVILMASAVSVGQSLSSIILEQVSRGGGRVLQCQMDTSDQASDNKRKFHAFIEKLSRDQVLRLVAKDQRYHYAALVSDAVVAAGGVKSYEIPNSEILFCTVSSFLPDSFRGFQSIR